jgi:hypothetical protein
MREADAMIFGDRLIGPGGHGPPAPDNQLNIRPWLWEREPPPWLWEREPPPWLPPAKSITPREATLLPIRAVARVDQSAANRHPHVLQIDVRMIIPYAPESPDGG